MGKTFSTLKVLDNKTFVITEYETETKKTELGIKFVVFCAILIIAIIVAIANKAPKGNISVSSFEHTGIVFPQSNNEYLTETDLEGLKNSQCSSKYTYQNLLRFSINEIYARHGHIFNEDGIYDDFYANYAWYRNTIKHTVTWTDFNEIEKSNLSMLIEEEKRNNFR